MQMNSEYISIAASSVVRLCCDRFESGDWGGRFYTRYQEKPVSFRNTGELLERLDGFYNWLGYPQASMENRSFRKKPSERRVLQETASPQEARIKQKGERSIVVNEEAMNKHQGEKATFVVRIQYRQNASWQGQVTWAEKNKTVPFRSALELLKLIDSTQEAPEESWDRGDE